MYKCGSCSKYQVPFYCTNCTKELVDNCNKKVRGVKTENLALEKAIRETTFDRQLVEASTRHRKNQQLQDSISKLRIRIRRESSELEVERRNVELAIRTLAKRREQHRSNEERLAGFTGAAVLSSRVEPLREQLFQSRSELQKERLKRVRDVGSVLQISALFHPDRTRSMPGDLNAREIELLVHFITTCSLYVGPLAFPFTHRPGPPRLIIGSHSPGLEIKVDLGRKKQSLLRSTLLCACINFDLIDICSRSDIGLTMGDTLNSRFILARLLVQPSSLSPVNKDTKQPELEFSQLLKLLLGPSLSRMVEVAQDHESTRILSLLNEGNVRVLADSTANSSSTFEQGWDMI